MGLFILAVFLIGLTANLLLLTAFILFLRKVSRTISLIEPENREISPGFVWLCLIPVAGIIAASFMVIAVARSLRKQFLALGQHDPGEQYGRITGLIWSLGSSSLIFFAVAEIMFEFEGAIDVIYSISLLLMFSFWIAYWIQVHQCCLKLQRFLSREMNQEEMDYDDAFANEFDAQKKRA